MNKKEALADFLRSLEISLKQASIYFREHPAFQKSVEDVKTRADAALNSVSPMKIYFTPYSLFIEEEHWEKERIHKELAKTFHHRMVKSIEITEGITIDELATFIIKANLPRKDILKRGGLKAILEREDISHLSVEALDYSQILRGKGEEIQDVWEYYLDEGLELEDPQKIDEITSNFEKVVPSYKAQEFLNNQELLENINKLFIYLKKTKKESFQNCAKVLLKSLLKHKDVSYESQFGKIQTLFKDLSDEDFAWTLWEELSTDKDFDSMSFNIFARLSGERKQEDIAHSLQGLIKKEDISGIQPDIMERLRELLMRQRETFVPEIYRNTLLTLFKEIKFEDKLAIDQNLLHHNYFYLIFEFLAQENKKERIRSLLEKILEEWENRDKNRELEYALILFPLLKNKHHHISSEFSLKKLRTYLSPILERAILRGDIAQDFDDQLDYLDQTSLNSDSYLNKIFREHNTHHYVLTLFFKFFPDEIEVFIELLKKRKAEVPFLEQVIQGLQSIESNIALTILTLESIFSVGNKNLKLKTLQAMQKLSKYDEDFLISILKKEDRPLNKEALTILARDDQSREKAFKTLLAISSPFGIKNRILMNNLILIEEMGLKKARPYLTALSRSRPFWNKRIKSKSLQILGKWDGR